MIINDKEMFAWIELLWLFLFKEFGYYDYKVRIDFYSFVDNNFGYYV